MQFDFSRDGCYTRHDVRELLGVEGPMGGPWFTGYLRHSGCWFLFCTIGESTTAGFEYGDRFEDGILHWSGRTNSHLRQESIRSLMRSDEVYVFLRWQRRGPFKFFGLGTVLETVDTSPVRITWRVE